MPIHIPMVTQHKGQAQTLCRQSCFSQRFYLERSVALAPCLAIVFQPDNGAFRFGMTGSS